VRLGQRRYVDPGRPAAPLKLLKTVSLYDDFANFFQCLDLWFADVLSVLEAGPDVVLDFRQTYLVIYGLAGVGKLFCLFGEGKF
jgi:hypothetical protein